MRWEGPDYENERTRSNNFELFQLVPASILALSLGCAFFQQPMLESNTDQKGIWRAKGGHEGGAKFHDY
ncbi:hypothetical protein JAAARDRAFT_42548 [Jaapia argillacea MUCL 33604]|uniref:Uncharacterized protein n=1 Tax=Jaapia argillacea MUCL 33604 TaxID=933084 RepID=A0A067P4Y5_9AGAM|nr:hypothetical protein JAAARDRAFT_42548 [Jaapia argillacea MUCL 33604]